MTDTTLKYHLNRLAGTLVADVPTLDAQGAANTWAGLGVSLNLVGNGSFETDITGWSSNAGTLSQVTTGSPPYGTDYLRNTATATSASIANYDNWSATSPGDQWTVAASVLRESGTRTAALRLRWRDASTAILSEDILAGVAPAAAWATRLVLTATAPASAAFVEVRLYANGTGSVGDIMSWDGVMLNRGGSALPYTAAASPATDLLGALNAKAGNTLPNYRGLAGVLNQLAGTTGLGVDGAAALIP